MWDFLLDLIKVNEDVNYSFIISLFVGYFFIIWFIISLWVFFDAKKRHSSVVLCILYWFFVFVFGPPALVFYIMIRPEHTLEENYYMNLALSGEKSVRPIYFDGNKGFDISINLSVQPKEAEDSEHKMYMNVEWFPNDQKGAELGKPRKRGESIRIIKKGFVTFVNKIKELPTKKSKSKKENKPKEKDTDKLSKESTKSKGKNKSKRNKTSVKESKKKS
ncbi:MAG: hypothetical protein ABIE03_03380 [Patescibacteria group bacterium]|nr:hypothetical protein [Patescibacteria group bacterium]